MIYVGLGANLPHPEYGPPSQTLDAALSALEKRDIRVRARSRWYVSPPWPASLAGQPWYVNGVAAIETGMGPDALLQTLHEVEWAFGRVRTAQWTPRQIDLDLVAHGDQVTATSALHGRATLPHPRMAQRAFVLLPLREIAPDWVHPVTGEHIDDLIARTDCSGVEPQVAVAQNHLAGGAAGS